MFERLAPIAIILVLGLLWQILRPGGMPSAELRRTLNTVNLYLLVPGLIFQVIGSTELPERTWLIPLAAWITLGLTLALSSLVYLRLLPGVAAPTRGAMILAGSFGNGVGLAMPVIVALYGIEAAPVPILYTLFGAIPLVWTVGVATALRAAGTGSGAALWQQVLGSPPLLAVIGALAWRATGLGYAPAVVTFLEMITAVALVVIVFVVGLSLSLRGVRRAGALLPALAIKSLLSPLIAFAVASLLGIEGVTRAALVLTAASASFNVGVVIADRYGLDADLYALSVAVSVVLFVLLVPLWTAVAG